MKTVWKFELQPETDIAMPVGAQILTVQEQNGNACLWALVDPNAPKEMRKIRAYGTGHTCPDNPGTYIGTFQMHKGGLMVFHVFEDHFKITEVPA